MDLDELDGPVERAAELIREATADGCTGFNVTHPCKQIVTGALDEVSANARRLGAVNAIVVRDGRLTGHNTDHSGFLTALKRGLPGVPVGRIVLIGAGGAGSAVAYALAAAGCADLRIADADPARATAVCDLVTGAFPATRVAIVPANQIAPTLRSADGVVNATPIGMTGFPGTPFDTGALHSRLWVADVVYRPQRTELIDAASALGCPVLDGTQMLVAQAADSFALLTGIQPDRDRMRHHLTTLLTRQSLPL
jgi:shikimate dehydrogenase